MVGVAVGPVVFVRVGVGVTVLVEVGVKPPSTEESPFCFAGRAAFVDVRRLADWFAPDVGA